MGVVLAWLNVLEFARINEMNDYDMLKINQSF